MKTQISRDGFRPEQRYSGVYQQQGRMITDRDWNELVDILKNRLDEGMADVVGSGLPRRRGVQIAKGTAGGLAVQPGVVYAGGVAARVVAAGGAAGASVPFHFDQQADFPSPPALPANRPYVLYADVWERPVTALEDGELRDPALNGADTTTRTRTMAQLKWAQAPWNPEDPAQNPPRGNGTLTVAVPARGTGDPLGAADPAGGDFLFRVEVHDVRYASNDASQPNELVLKWSRENGAEQHRALEAPSSFKAGTWIYELFQQESDLLLGHHAVSGWQPARGQLIPGFPFLTPQTAADSLIRRWDGFCAVYRSGGSWVFSPNANQDPARTAPGAAVSLNGSRLTVRLIDLELTFDLQGKTFLAGDSWQVPVRRAIHLPGDRIVTSALPSGIVHRYVTLANVNAVGDVTPVLPSFSALSELTAADLRYDGTGCRSGLFDASHDTVKKALDRLWQLGAEHAAYAKPANTSLYKDKTVATVRDALNLLSDVRARQIAYDGRAGVPDVQTAVDELFARPNGDAEGFTVGSGGELPNLMTALQTLLTGSRRDVRLVLLPGDHELDTTVPIAPPPGVPAHLTLSGSGWATRLLVRKTVSFNDFASVTFQGLAIELDPDMFLEVRNGELSLLDNRISGFSKEGLFRPAGCPRLLVRDNIVEVSVQDPVAQPAALLAPLDSEPSLRMLLSTRSPRLFALRAQALVEAFRALSPAVRLQRAVAVETNVGRSPADFPRQVYNDLVASLRQGPDARTAALLASVRQQEVQWAGAGVFLQIGVPNIPTRLESNQIFGTVALYGSPGSELSTADLSLLAGRMVGGLGFDISATADLIATGNRMSGFQVASSTIATLRSAGTSVPIVPLFQRLALSDNTFDATGNQLVANSVELSGNLLTGIPFGWVVGEEVLFVGNVARVDINVDTVARNLVQAGNSAHVRIRPASPAIPK